MDDVPKVHLVDFGVDAAVTDASPEEHPGHDGEYFEAGSKVPELIEEEGEGGEDIDLEGILEAPALVVEVLEGGEGTVEEEEAEAKQERALGPQNTSGDVFAVCHILATWNDTFIHVTDLTGRETLIRVTGGMKVKSDRDESSPYAAMQAAIDVVNRLKQLNITALHIKLRARGGNDDKAPGPGAQSALRAIARNGIKIGRIEDVTPIPTDTTRRGSRKGRRL